MLVEACFSLYKLHQSLAPFIAYQRAEVAVSFGVELDHVTKVGQGDGSSVGAGTERYMLAELL